MCVHAISHHLANMIAGHLQVDSCFMDFWRDNPLETVKGHRHLHWWQGVLLLLKAFLVYAGTQAVSSCSVCPGYRIGTLPRQTSS